MTGVIKLDPWLDPFKETIKYRFNEAQKWIKKIDDTEGGLEKFSRVNMVRLFHNPKAKCRIQGFERFGFNVLPNNDIVYREWAPNALRAYLVGDFSTYVFSFISVKTNVYRQLGFQLA